MGFFDIFKKNKPVKQEKHDYISNDEPFKRQDKVKINGDLESGITLITIFLILILGNFMILYVCKYRIQNQFSTFLAQRFIML